MQINFKFEINQKVITIFGDIGIIDMFGFNEAGNLYYVKRKTSESWLKEDQIEAIEKNEN